MTGGWSQDARDLPIWRWVTAQVLLVSTQSVHVMVIRRESEWSAYATWTIDGERREEVVQLVDIAAWRDLEERNHVPSHVPRKKRLAVVPSTVTDVGPAECINGSGPSATAASSAGSTPSASRVKCPAPILSRRGFAVVAASDPERIWSEDGRRATEAGPTGGGSGDTSAAGKPGPNVDGAREGGPRTRQGGSVNSATVRAGGRPAHLDLPPGPTEAEQAAAAAAYAARVRSKKFDPSVQPGVPDSRPYDLPMMMETLFVRPPPEIP